MEKENRNIAYSNLVELFTKQGYITFDDVMDVADAFSLSIQDFDWLSSRLTSSGILIYDSPPHHINTDKASDEEYDDFAQVDYTFVYNRIVELNPSLKPFVDTVRNILPPQFREVSQLKYQVVDGNEYARKRMIEMHIRIALRIALQRSETYDLDIVDTISSAIIGLIIAIDKYDPDISGAFSSYAALWIIQNISRDQTNMRPLIYYPVHKKEEMFSIYPFLKKYGCTICDNAAHCDKLVSMIMDKNKCNRDSAEDIILQITPGECSDLDTFIDEDEYNKFCIENELLFNSEDDLAEHANRLFISTLFKECLHSLSPKEEMVISNRYGLIDGYERTLGDIGREMGITRERVRQIESKGLKKLKRSMRKYLEECNGV